MNSPPYTDFQGYSVALAGDGNTAIVGGPGDDRGLGAAWVFTRQITPLTQIGTLSATILTGDRVRLDWTTLSENSNQGFTVERSPNNPNTFNPVPNGFVPGYGTSTISHSYSFIDSTVGSGIWYYRLKLVSLSGTYFYSTAVPATTVTGVKGSATPRQFALYQSYPNPFNPSTMIRYDVARLSQVTLKVYNMLGQEVVTLVNEEKSPGNYQVVLNAGANMASGVYFYRLEATAITDPSKTFTSVKKMLLVK